MRYLLFLLLVAAMFSLANCDDKNPSEPVCDEGCSFVLTAAPGTITRMGCFERFGIKALHPQNNTVVYGIPDHLEARFEEEGKSVIFSGVFRANTLVPAFPDPDIAAESVYQMNVLNIQ